MQQNTEYSTIANRIRLFRLPQPAQVELHNRFAHPSPYYTGILHMVVKIAGPNHNQCQNKNIDNHELLLKIV